MTPMLQGVRVLDLTSIVVGPACTLRLADHGAEVIKLEPPEGDMLRRLGGDSPSGAVSPKYLHFNRRKRAICLDLRKPGGRRALERVLDGVDVLVSNMRPEALARLGLDPATARATRPRLIHCTITGFGPGGPYRGRAAYDTVVQGAAGVVGLFGQRDGTPRYVPLVFCDHTVGEIAAGAILAALYARERHGEGAAIEVPMLETMAAFVLREHLGGASFEPPTDVAGDHRILTANNAPLQTADGWISVCPNTDAQVRGFLGAIGQAALLEDPRFATIGDRVRNAPEWFAISRDAVRHRPTAHWLAALAAADVPAMPCHRLADLPRDPHLEAVGLLQGQTHPTEGHIRSLRPTILVDGATPAPGPPAEAQGASTQAVLAEAGLDEAEIDSLIAEGAAR
ncbi:MAG: CoA transferase [Acidisphaera sp.]|nr:CoA transferase [Acidisphaera sp.]